MEPQSMNDEMNRPVSPAPQINPYVLPASILIAALLIAGAVIFAFGRGGGSGEATYPNNAFAKCLDSHKYKTLVDSEKSAATAVQGTPATFVNGQFLNGALPWEDYKDATGKTQMGFHSVIEKAVAAGKKDWPAQATDVSTGQKVANVPALSSDDVIKGDPNAPVTIIEYGDYQCPFCARVFTDIEPLIDSQYINTGKVKMAFRDYPFLGNESQAAAEAAQCAKDQGKYWEYHDALYTAEHADGHENNGNMTKTFFQKIAADLKLNAK